MDRENNKTDTIRQAAINLSRGETWEPDESGSKGIKPGDRVVIHPRWEGDSGEFEGVCLGFAKKSNTGQIIVRLDKDPEVESVFELSSVEKI